MFGLSLRPVAQVTFSGLHDATAVGTDDWSSGVTVQAPIIGDVANPGTAVTRWLDGFEAALRSADEAGLKALLLEHGTCP
jgi:hypothetical protein